MLHLTCIRLWKCWGILRVIGNGGIPVLLWPLLLRWGFVNSCFAYDLLGILKQKIRKQENLVQWLSFAYSHTFWNLYFIQTLWVSFSLWISSTLAWHPSCMEGFTLPYIYLYLTAYTPIELSQSLIPLWDEQHTHSVTQVTVCVLQIQQSSHMKPE